MMSLFSNFDYMLYSPFLFYVAAMKLNFNTRIQKYNVNKLAMSKFMKFMSTFFLSLKPKKFNKTMINTICSLMITLAILNMSSVTSYIYAPTSQVSMIMFISVTMWMSFVMFMLFKNIKSFAAHCIPEGTPIYLTWFLFLIELISNLIRPLTLTVRLVANIMAGHLLMILLSKLVFSNLLFSSVYLLLNLVEFFVGLIQAYIFVTMIVLYYAELA